MNEWCYPLQQFHRGHNEAVLCECDTHHDFCSIPFKHHTQAVCDDMRNHQNCAAMSDFASLLLCVLWL